MTVEFVKSEWVNLSEIAEDPMNPNVINKAQHESLSKSMDENGFIEDVLLNDKPIGGKRFTLINGHQRVYVLLEKGEKRVLAKIIKVSVIKARQIGWAMNRNVGQDDQEKLSNLLLYALKNDKLDMFLDSVPDFGEDKAKLLIDKFHDTGLSEEGDEEIPEVTETSKVKEGDLFQLGDHRLLCGDSTKKEHVDKLFAGKVANHVNMDPPYGVDYLGKDHFLKKINKPNSKTREIANDNMNPDDYTEFFKKVLANIPLAEYNTLNIWMGGLRLDELTRAFKEEGFTWGDYLVWVKNQFVLGRKDHNPRHEFCLYGWKGKHKFYGGQDASSCYFENKPLTSEDHPTMKPVNLIARTILEGTKPKDIVYDAFCGSGTSIIACENENRICYAIEMMPHYIDVIIRRWEEKTNKKAVKL